MVDARLEDELVGVCGYYQDRRPAAPGSPTGVRAAMNLTAVSLSIAVAGLPNVGKSTLFNALTKNDALAANYPFATIEPNVGVVGVPDPRLTVLGELFGSGSPRSASRRT